MGRPESASSEIEGPDAHHVRHATQITVRDRCGISRARCSNPTGLRDRGRRKRRGVVAAGRHRVLACLSNTHLKLIDQHRDVEQVGVIGRHGARRERMHERLEVREAANGSARKGRSRVREAETSFRRLKFERQKSKRKRMSGLFDAKTDEKETLSRCT